MPGLAGCYGLLALWKVLQWAPWRRLSKAQQLHVFLGSTVALILLWGLRTQIEPGFSWHLFGMTALTLMFGWSLAVIGGCWVLLRTTLAGLNDWAGCGPSAVIQVLLPASLTQVALGLASVYLPRHYFVYVFVNAFLTGGLAAIASALATAGLLLTVSAFTLDRLQQHYLVFLPLMFFLEAVLNGWTCRS